MEYRKIGDNYYIRMDRGDEIISTLLAICEKESIPSAVFSGIGGWQSAELQVFIPATGSFETEQLEGMLELVSLNGNVVRDDDGKLFHRTHALFSFKKDGQHGMAGGHLKATTVLYTAEIAEDGHREHLHEAHQLRTEHQRELRPGCSRGYGNLII